MFFSNSCSLSQSQTVTVRVRTGTPRVVSVMKVAKCFGAHIDVPSRAAGMAGMAIPLDMRKTFDLNGAQVSAHLYHRSYKKYDKVDGTCR